jgi:CxxC-x17-CxxC domain-containing protein
MRNFNRDKRDFRRRSFGGRVSDRQMHKTICSECGNECEVPFKPTGTKPVYCSECFKKHGGGADSRRFQDRSPRRPSFEKRYEPGPQINEQLEVINRKLDKILEMFKVPFVKEQQDAPAKPKKPIMIAQKKTKTTKKKTSEE